MGRFRKIDAEKGSRIVELLEDGNTVGDISEEMELSKNTIYRFCREEGISLKRGRRSGVLYANTSPIKRWLLTHPGEVLDKDVDKLAETFGVTKKYVWDYLWSKENQLKDDVEGDKAYFNTLLRKASTKIIYKSTAFPMKAIREVVLTRKKYTRQYRVKFILQGGQVLLTDYFTPETYGKVIHY